MDVVSVGETMVLFTPETTGQMRYAKQFSSRIAGAETNTLIGLAKLGHQAGWISRVGKDEFGSSILSFVRGEGVDVSRVKQTTGASTGIFFKEIVSEKNVRIHYYRKDSAASLLAPQDIDEDYIAQSKYLYITGITPALSESCRDMTFYAMDVAKKNGVQIVFDPNVRRKLWDDELARKTLLRIAEKSDIILPGISEGEFLFNVNHHKEIAQLFHQLGAKVVVVKLGEQGAYYSANNESGHIEAVRIEHVVDPVGAGDGFAAGLLSGLLDDLEMKQAVARACTVGAMVTTVNGDVEGLPDRDALESFIRSSPSDEVSR
ncbi:sugar kinase [Paenibacillus terreus]|uniref:Sugar kinase n=1 Tax=Paenibacillus terreus TaxID=1387834 RepID=A0ABV5B5X2_9BACL